MERDDHDRSRARDRQERLVRVRRRRLALAAAIIVPLLLIVAFRAAFAHDAATPRPTTAASPTATLSTTTAPSPAPSSASPEAEAFVPAYDRNFKADLVDRLETPPELIVFGGSRAQRFEPSYVRRLTGLSAFNFALHNGKVEDAYAVSSYLFSKEPDLKLRCFFAVQVGNFGDAPLHPGLLWDPRFSRWFPAEFVQEQREIVGKPKQGGMSGDTRYSERGCLLHNSYDERVARGVSLEAVLDVYIERILPRVSAPGATQTRSRRYFRKLLKLYNDHGVTPAIVVMPYHPVPLEAFRAVGWQAKNDRLLRFLRGLEDTYDLRVLDYTEITSFGGRPEYFYDGSHVTKENARLILEQAVRDAPECF
jgi:hypothetical protein